MLLHKNGKLTMGELKSSLLFLTGPHSILRCISRHVADLVVSVGYIRSTKSLSLELFSVIVTFFILLS